MSARRLYRPPRPSRLRETLYMPTGGAGVSELFFTFSAPALTDLQDADVAYTLGVDFQSSSALPCTGVQWRVPDTAPSGSGEISLWLSADGTKLAGKTITFTGLGGAVRSWYFDTPVNLSANTAYRASVLTVERYVATTNASWPQTAGVLTAGTDNGWLKDDTDGTPTALFPDTESGNNANFHVSPILQVTA